MYKKIVHALATAAVLPFAHALLEGSTTKKPTVSKNISDITWNYPTWTGPVFPGGKNVSIKGTVQHIMANIKKMNPDYEFPKVPKHSMALDKRTTDLPIYHVCLPGQWGFVSVQAVWEGADYLDTLSGEAEMGAHDCYQISCSYDSAIGWCNGNMYPLHALWSDLATRARYTVEACFERTGTEPGGQTLYPDNTSVITHNGSC